MNWYYFLSRKLFKKNRAETQEGDIINRQPISHSTCYLFIQDTNRMAGMKE